MNCEASERSSDFDRQNEDEVNEFKREIEERFKLSIANKLYTFPKVIRYISDLLSSSDSDSEDASSRLPPNGLAPPLGRHFKKSRAKESPGKEQERSYMGESSKKGKDKLKTSDSTSKRRDEENRLSSKMDKTRKDKKKEKGRGEPEPTAFLETIRHKIAKRN
jgi:hypothetical protein